ncbi:calmodulin-binding protein 25-like [Solanum tuberosum]|uniref:VQ n=1 Tax=Solanum tuberosum TaxID=4113 RepID=M1CQD4_SOLTU|nr:PREDICTED: calmodulin-binding protein 25-like [Solanum tuberosum]
MASSDNLMTMEQWGFRSAFNDSWFTDIFAKETETLTKVLQKSYTGEGNEVVMPIVEMGSPFLTPSASGPTFSGGSENDAASTGASGSMKRRNGGGGMSKKIVKRKPRASKRASTTYITADVDSFRQMVQQVTGARISGNGNGQLSVSSILKPEPRRPVDRVQPVSCLPTLDTSAFLLDPTSSFMHPPPAMAGSVAVRQPSAVVVDGGYGFDSFCGFPTLESGM